MLWFLRGDMPTIDEQLRVLDKRQRYDLCRSDYVGIAVSAMLVPAISFFLCCLVRFIHGGKANPDWLTVFSAIVPALPFAIAFGFFYRRWWIAFRGGLYVSTGRIEFEVCRLHNPIGFWFSLIGHGGLLLPFLLLAVFPSVAAVFPECVGAFAYA